MQNTVKVFHKETANNIYNFGYKVTSKTTYEQREEHRENLIYFAKQKLLGILLLLIGIYPAIYAKSILVLLCFSFFWIIGVAVLITKERVIG